MSSVGFPVLLLAISIITFVQRGDACSCPPKTFKEVFHSSDWVIRAEVRKVRRFDVNTYYEIKVTNAYKGCRRATPFFIRTFTQGGSCGVSMKLYSSYIIPIKYSTHSPGVTIDSCQLVTEYDRLSQEDLQFLNKRSACCSTCECVLDDKQECAVLPCSTASPPCTEATKCVDNFCGGCSAEWFTDSGKPACLPELPNPFFATF